jgi:hypothetical protein
MYFLNSKAPGDMFRRNELFWEGALTWLPACLPKERIANGCKSRLSCELKLAEIDECKQNSVTYPQFDHHLLQSFRFNFF